MFIDKLKEPPSGGSFLLGGEQKPRGAVRVRKKLPLFFTKNGKNFSAARQKYFGGEDAKRPVSRWWATGRFAVFQRRNEVRYTKLPHSAGLFTMYHISLHNSTKNLHKING